MKAMLATNVDLDNLKFPVFCSPKIDGVRAVHFDNKFTGRSGKPFKNQLVMKKYQHTKFNGLDGEMVAGNPFSTRVCNKTTSALATIKSTVLTNWCLFDYVNDEEIPFKYRYESLIRYVSLLQKEEPDLTKFLWVVPQTLIYDLKNLEALETKYLEMGYEGLIIRDPEAPYKFGRSTVNEGYLLRLKRFCDAEIKITNVVEGQSNYNLPGVNPLGYSERPTHKDNMKPSGMVGTIRGKLLQDIKLTKSILKKGSIVTIGPGRLSHDDRIKYFNNPRQIIGRIATFKYFPQGGKDTVRFPTFQNFREDL